MSTRIGEVPRANAIVNARVYVQASVGGVEINSDAMMALSPIEARNFAALLVRAADEVERMRDREARK